MKWKELQVEKFAGKSLPQVLGRDPDWFYWAGENGVYKGELLAQAKVLGRRSRKIKIPTGKVALYFTNPLANNSFDNFRIENNSVPKTGNHCVARLEYLDMYIPRSIKEYDKLGYQNFLQTFKEEFFEGGNLTKKRLEEFWGNPSNFCE